MAQTLLLIGSFVHPQSLEARERSGAIIAPE